ncbi:MAG: hypothetical protein A3B74_03830 [Candidatus Kerfeldbacteria bacterium RIFCSPHIGHO2_02_FULL_42_14]|uniref:O-antigen ligase-related domain-containing protein n=1 Tax=Candidatus Kerfeldbacteria bacterium RIFCSPHIGHO2_02_FULL_42_14 TaxID=1798540 RepID=A0A1G2AR22_9BACT|nr:MAG: hypothetical protein A3B74_03830 [Candidatus Kerfeldbacteria bacterium RIFCSPHIGHO2_02_FULL_42_14]OGY80643.1 MAG: hypothetical protein A3E60_04330 [Candidatus Kerfeldbacteria bacterium RIFCSPHIGHO2_12_FULL_42_13]OGY82567.1 MAG: hypothetical protein A3I91_03990 [Candidatus Kerfeldbacteria bacterium RIFCSPLOWO2_02_FULL_42_19]OGY85171.1 MAG: hypothetical protein A3G01_01120 [Candidatus Kerfeldbacteria bacterium RIFCSPLOWO2_12_FULL_43_9]
MASHQTQTTISGVTIDFRHFFQAHYHTTLLALLAFEVLSFLSFLFLPLNTLFCVFFIFFTFLLSLHDLRIGVFIALAELVVASKGYLFYLDFGSFLMSLRLGIFLAVMFAWFLTVLRGRRQIQFFHSRHWKFYLLFFVVIFFGIVNGFMHYNTASNIFYDVNGFLYFGFVFPFFDALRTPKDFLQALQVMFAGITVTILKSLFLLFIFSQQFLHVLPPIYKWVRVTGVGEITLLGNFFYRIFFQSHVYEVIFFFLIFSFCIFPKRKHSYSRFDWSVITRGALCLLVIFLSYSRSFWLGTIMALFLIYLLLFFYWHLSLKRLAFSLFALVLVFFIDYALIFGTVNFPLPNRAATFGLTSLLTERTEDLTEEAASASRFQLLGPLLQKNISSPLFGTGFGSTVRYQTRDPRALETHPDGWYTTYAFEWGYLDLWLKLGLIGLVIYLWLLLKIILDARVFFKHPENDSSCLVIGVLFGVIALILINATTPFLNHPLGIGWIIFVSALVEVFRNHYVSSHQTNQVA